MAYRRYTWAISVIVATLLGVVAPTIDIARELVDESAPVAHRVAPHEHAPEQPPTTRVDLPQRPDGTAGEGAREAARDAASWGWRTRGAATPE